MSTKDKADGYLLALADAAKVLRDTADDLDECAQRQGATRNPTPNELYEVRVMREKARLLRGQIRHIEELGK